MSLPVSLSMPRSTEVMTSWCIMTQAPGSHGRPAITHEKTDFHAPSKLRLRSSLLTPGQEPRAVPCSWYVMLDHTKVRCSIWGACVYMLVRGIQGLLGVYARMRWYACGKGGHGRARCASAIAQTLRYDGTHPTGTNTVLGT